MQTRLGWSIVGALTLLLAAVLVLGVGSSFRLAGAAARQTDDASAATPEPEIDHDVEATAVRPDLPAGNVDRDDDDDLSPPIPAKPTEEKGDTSRDDGATPPAEEATARIVDVTPSRPARGDRDSRDEDGDEENLPRPRMTLTASGSCRVDGSFAGRLTLTVRRASITVADLLVRPRSGGDPVAPETEHALPLTAPIGVETIEWWLAADEAGLAPPTVLVRIPERSEGDEWREVDIRASTQQCRIPSTPTPEPTPSRSPEPDATDGESAPPRISLSIRAHGACTVDGGFEGAVSIRASRAAEISSLLVVPRPGAAPVTPLLDVELPFAFGRQRVELVWRLAPDPEGLAPTAVLMQVIGVPGSATATDLAADGSLGWRQVDLRSSEADCQFEQPGAGEAAMTPAPSSAVIGEPAKAGEDDGGISISGASSYTASIADLTLPAVSYSHENRTSVGAMSLSAEDNLANPGLGWHVTIQVSDFVYSGTNGGTNIPAANLNLTAAAAPAVVSGQAVDATNGPKTPPGLTLPVTLDSARKVLQAEVGFGQGSYTQVLDVALTIPGTSRAGTYIGSMIVTIASGP